MTDQNTATSPTFLEKLRNNDNIAWTKFYALLHPLIVSECKKRGLSDEETDEVCQQVAVRVFSSVKDRFELRPGKKSFRPWVYAIAINQIFALKREHHRVGKFLDTLRENFIAETDVQVDNVCQKAEISLADIENLALRKALDETRIAIEPKSWQWFQMYANSLSPAEIAILCDEESSKVVRQSVYRTLKSIRDRVTKYEKEMIE